MLWRLDRQRLWGLPGGGEWWAAACWFGLRPRLADVVAARGWAEHSTCGAVDGPDVAEGELGNPLIGVLKLCGLVCTMPALTMGATGAEGRRAGERHG
jgi:hypothetical protein